MALNAKSLALSGGIIWGAAIFLVTLANVYAGGYGELFLGVVGSIYPGYTITLAGSVVGLVWGFVDAAIGFYILAWLYNKFEK